MGPLAPEDRQQLRRALAADGIEPGLVHPGQQLRERLAQQTVDALRQHPRHPALDLGIAQPGRQILFLFLQIGNDLLLQGVAFKKAAGHGAHRPHGIKEVIDPAQNAFDHLSAQGRLGQLRRQPLQQRSPVFANQAFDQIRQLLGNDIAQGAVFGC